MSIKAEVHTEQLWEEIQICTLLGNLLEMLQEMFFICFAF